MEQNGQLLQESDIFVSSPGKLPFKKIIHAVGPTWRDGGQNERTLLQTTIKNVLQEVCSQSLVSVAMPCISAGIFRYPVRKAADVIVRTVMDFCNGTDYLKCIYLVDKSAQTVTAFKNVLQQGKLNPRYYCYKYLVNMHTNSIIRQTVAMYVARTYYHDIF